MLYLVHSLNIVVTSPPLHTDHFLPSGNISRILCSTISCDKPVSTPSVGVVLLVNTLLLLGVDPPFFITFSVFVPSGW